MAIPYCQSSSQFTCSVHLDPLGFGWTILRYFLASHQRAADGFFQLNACWHRHFLCILSSIKVGRYALSISHGHKGNLVRFAHRQETPWVSFAHTCVLCMGWCAIVFQYPRTGNGTGRLTLLKRCGQNREDEEADHKRVQIPSNGLNANTQEATSFSLTACVICSGGFVLVPYVFV